MTISTQRLRLLRGNSAAASAFTGLQGELVFDTTLYTLRLQDGTTPGGYTLATSADLANISTNVSANTGNITFNNQTITGTVANAAIILDPSGAGAVLFHVGSSNANITIVNVSSSSNGIARITTPNAFAIGSTGDLRIFSGNGTGGIFEVNAATGHMGFGTTPVDGYEFSFNGSAYASEFYAQANLPTGYQFTTPQGDTGLSHVYQNDANGNISLLRLRHDNSIPARFYENNTTLLSGNLVVSQNGNVFGTSFPNAFVQVYSNINSYSQAVFQNLNNGPQASFDVVLTAGNGSDSSYFGDFGIASNTYSYPGYGLIKPNDVYLLAVGNNITGPGSSDSGNLILGTTTGNINMFVGAPEDANVIAQLNTTGFIPGANVTYSLGSSTRQWKDLWLSNNTLYLGGTPITVSNGVLSVNGSIVSGNYSNTNVASYLTSLSNVKIGFSAGYTNQGFSAVAIGPVAAATNQGSYSVAIGSSAGQYNQGNNSVAIGTGAAASYQGLDAVAIGTGAGGSFQGNGAVAIGSGAGGSGGSEIATVAIGYGATTGGNYAVSLGTYARGSNANTIVINATGSVLNSYSSGFYVDPVSSGTSGNVLYYNTSTKQITYGAAPETYGNANVAAYLPNYGGTVNSNRIINALDVNLISESFVQAQYDPSGNYDPYTLGEGSWFYLGSPGVGGGLVFESNLTGTPHSVRLTDLGAIVADAGITFDGNLTNGSNTWTFDSNGNVTLPGSIHAEFITSPAAKITGFEIDSTRVDVSGNVTAANFIGNIQGPSTVFGNLNVTGNLVVSGNTITVSTNNFVVSDNIIFMANNNPANILDIGFAAHYTTDALRHTGFVKDVTDGTWKLFSNVPQEITTTVDFTNAIYDPIRTGNITAPYFVGNGALLTGISASSSYGNTNVAAYLSGNVSIGNLTANTNVTVTSNLIVGSGAGGFLFRPLVGGSGATIYSLNAAPSQTNYALSYNGASLNLNAPTGGGIYSSIQNSIVTSLTSTGLAVTGVLSATGNITGNNIVGNSFTYANGLNILSGVVGNYANANVAAYLASNSAVPIVTTSNVTAGNLTVSGNITDTGALSIITGSNGNISLIPNGTGIVTISSAVTATGNITGNFFVGNGSLLTGIVANTTYSNTNVASYLTGNIVVGNISGSQPGVTLVANTYSYLFSNVGNVSFPGNLTVIANTSVGNIFATGYYYANGTAFTGTGGSSNYSNTNVASYLPTYSGNISNISFANGNIDLGGVQTPFNQAGTLLNVKGIVGMTASSGANISGFSVVSAATVSAGSFTYPNGTSILTGLGGTYNDANVAAYLPTYTGNIAANIVKGTSAWTFSANGALVLPASMGQVGRESYTNGMDLYNNNGGVGYVRMNFNDQSFVWVDPAGAHIQSTGGTWDFSANGNLTVPGRITNGDGATISFGTNNARIDVGNGTTYVDIQDQDLFLISNTTIISSNGNTWDFVANGNLILPSNNSTIIYPNGASILSGITGGSSNYSNANVASFLGSYGSNTIVTTGNITAGYFVGNGALLTGITATANYGNTNVTAFLGSYGSNTIVTTGNITAGNLNVTGNIVDTGALSILSGTNSNLSLIANGTGIISVTGALIGLGNVVTAYSTQSGITTVFIGNNTTITAGGGSSNSASYMMNNLYFQANGQAMSRNTNASGAGQFEIAGGTFNWNATGSSTANTAAGMGARMSLSSTALATQNSVGITSAGTLTVQGASGIVTTQTTFPLLATTATTINFGNVASVIAMGANAGSVIVGNSVGNITAGNIIATQFGNSTGTTATYTGNVTAGNVVTTGVVALSGGNVSGVGNLVGVTSNTTITANTFVTSFLSNGAITTTSNVIVTGSNAISIPNLPAFRVYGNTSTVFTSGNTITNQAIDYNQGSYYNNATGFFTAPVAGLYHCYATIRVATNNALNQASLQKNSSNSGANVIAFWETDTNTGTATHFSITGYAKCAVGDTVRLQVLVGNVQFDSNDSWGVTFIG